MPFNEYELQSIAATLSEPRFSTYLTATSKDSLTALRLYEWNMRASSAFMIPIQICEISARNAIVRAIEQAHGTAWPWNSGFAKSLPGGNGSLQENLKSLIHHHTAGKIVAELKFVFWQKMMTARHDAVIWNNHLRASFPNADPVLTVQQIRGDIYQRLEKIRMLRNRIAHHEPIFSRDIKAEYDCISGVVRMIDRTTADWMERIQGITALIASKPEVTGLKDDSSKLAD